MQITRTCTLLALALLGGTGCAGYPPSLPGYDASTEHYRSLERFDRILFDVTVASGTPQLASLANDVKHAGTQYLEQNKIAAVPAVAGQAANMTMLTLQILKKEPGYGVHARLTASDGSIIEETPLYLNAAGLQGESLAQHLATLAIDDLLLLWYPSDRVGGGAQSTAAPAKFALLMDELPRQTIGGETRLSWEEFPSARILEGSSVSAADISDVTYELRIHKAGRMVVFHRYQRSMVYRKSNIQEAEFTLPFALPSCEDMVWSVRARFDLGGHRRVTEWSGHSSTSYNGLGPLPILPPYVHRRTLEQEKWGPLYRSFPLEHHAGGGTKERIKPPDSIRCGELGRGIVDDDDTVADADFENPLEPLAPGQSIAVTASSERRCISDDCKLDAGTEDTSVEMAACFAREFKRRSLNIAVTTRNGIPPGTTDGIRYWLKIQTHVSEGATTRDFEISDSGLFEEDSQTTHYSSWLEASVIDGDSGDELGRISSSDTGVVSRSTVSAAFLLWLPVMYLPVSGIGDLEKNACDEVARRLSFMLRGGISSGWPEEHFRPITSRLW